RHERAKWLGSGHAIVTKHVDAPFVAGLHLPGLQGAEGDSHFRRPIIGLEIHRGNYAFDRKRRVLPLPNGFDYLRAMMNDKRNLIVSIVDLLGSEQNIDSLRLRMPVLSGVALRSDIQVGV